MKYLAPEAAVSLIALENDTDGLVYQDMWRDGVASLASRRIRRTSQLPSYSLHNYGMAVDLDLQTILEKKQIRYEDLLYMMKKRGWFCHRRDGKADLPEAGHFNFLGEKGERYLTQTTLDPTTWQRPAETRVFERWGGFFQLDLRTIQEKLNSLGFYKGPITSTNDTYTREAIMAFQRAWDLIVDGLPGMNFCRVLAFISAELTFR